MYHSGLISSATNTPTKNLENDQEEDEEEGEDEEESDFGNHHHQHQHGRSGNEQEGGNSPPPSPLIEWSVSRANLCHKLLDQVPIPNSSSSFSHFLSHSLSLFFLIVD